MCTHLVQNEATRPLTSHNVTMTSPVSSTHIPVSSILLDAALLHSARMLPQTKEPILKKSPIKLAYNICL